MSLVSVMDRNWAQTGERVERVKTGETAESPVFMRLFVHFDENTERGGWDLMSIPPSPPCLKPANFPSMDTMVPAQMKKLTRQQKKDVEPWRR